MVLQFGPSTTSLVSTPNPSGYSQNVRFTATVTGGLSLPTGYITFRDSGAIIDSVALDSSGTAILNIASLAAGPHPVIAYYTGDLHHASSNSVIVRQIVGPARTTNVVSYSPDVITYGQVVTFVDTIFGTLPDGGTVQFNDGGNNLGSAVPVDSSGRATLTTSILSAGWHPITAVYSGTSNVIGSTSHTVYVEVHQRQTNGKFSVSSTVIRTGDLLTMKDSIVGADPDSGSVQFMDGTSPLGSPLPIDENGIATYSTSTMVSGVHALYAEYLGTNNFASNSSGVINVTVSDSGLYRSFDPDSIALSLDNFGKKGRMVKRKNIRVSFAAVFIPQTNGLDGLHVEFAFPIDTSMQFYSVPPATKALKDNKLSRWNFTFPRTLNAFQTVKIYGFGKTGRMQKVTKHYWMISGSQEGTTLKQTNFEKNQLMLPMPNRINVLAETYRFNGFSSTGGLLVGKNRKTPVDSSKYYGWLLAPKYANALNSLWDRTGVHTGYARGFDFFTSNNHPLVRRQMSMRPSKENNILIADMIALKLNISASALGITPPGFGELIFRDSVDNPLNGMMVKQVASFIDSVMMGWYSGIVHRFADTSVFRKLHESVRRIDDAFEGTMDTMKFADTLRMPGTRPLGVVYFLHHDPTIPPTQISPVIDPDYDIPATFRLYQNYPNPFNPTTTIALELPYASVVTLKVYNILGQEVATLLDQTPLDNGTLEIQFDGRNLSSGVYFYRATFEQTVDNTDEQTPAAYGVLTKKMMLMK